MDNDLTPSKSADFSFVNLSISMKLLAQNASKLDRDIDKLDDRISGLKGKVDQQFVPILNYIESCSHDKEKIEKLSEAIKRLAVITEARDKLVVQRSMLELAQSKPIEFINLFGDFSAEIDPFLQTLLGTEPSSSEPKELNEKNTDD